MNMARPKKYKTEEELIAVLDKYFDTCRVPTIEGMARALGVSRHTVANYGRSEEFFSTINEYRARINEFLMEGMLLNELHAQGTMFNLRNNYGYDKDDGSDKRKPVEVTVNMIEPNKSS